MFCTKCGVQSSNPSQQFCGSCGAQMSSIPAPAQNWGTPAPAQNWSQQYPNQQQQTGYSNAPKMNNFALIGFVLSVTYCASTVGFILSIVGLVQINKDPYNQKGKGLAIAGIVLGAIGMIISILFGFASAFFSDDYYY